MNHITKPQQERLANRASITHSGNEDHLQGHESLQAVNDDSIFTGISNRQPMTNDAIDAFNAEASRRVAVQQCIDNYDQYATYNAYKSSQRRYCNINHPVTTPPIYENTTKLPDSRRIEVFTNVSKFLQYECGLSAFRADLVKNNIIDALHEIYEGLAGWDKIKMIIFNCSVNLLDFSKINELIDHLKDGIPLSTCKKQRVLEKLAESQRMKHNGVSRDTHGLESIRVAHYNQPSIEVV